MRRVLTTVALGLLLSSAAWAAPIAGTYNSPDAGTDFLNGRWSESYAGGGQGQVGDVIHAASWDGAALATQWELSGPAISLPPTLAFDGVVNGAGERIYVTTYAGGTLTLKDTGPWAGGADADYLVDVTTYRHTTTFAHAGGQPQTFRTTAFITGTFRDYPGYEVNFAIGAALPFGMNGALPADYPAFVGANVGDWGAVQKITLSIVPEPLTLALLALGALVVRRRR